MKPILFNTEMVRAILEDRKTVTRRVMKPQPELVDRFWIFGDARWSDSVRTVTPLPGHTLYNRAPYRHGDILWVRETWAKDTDGEFAYRTDYGETEDDSFPPSMFKWHPSIHMPREAARIFLRVIDMRVERLQDITLEDIKREGIGQEGGDRIEDWLGKPRKWWINTWNGTIKPKDAHAYGWDADPWVWRIRFERITKEETDQDGWV